MNSYQSESANQALLVMGGTMLVIFIITLLIVLLQGIGIMKLAKRNNINHSWLAFIPIANTYICGQVAFENKAKAFIFLAINIILSIFSSISCLNTTSYTEIKTTVSLFSWIYMILFFYASYQIFKKYSDKPIQTSIIHLIQSHSVTSAE